MVLRTISVLLLLTATLPAAAERHHGGDDRVSFGHDIDVREGDTAADIVCAFCKVRLHGDAGGDVAVLFGSVVVDPGHSIGGDVALLGGDVDLGEGASVGGDAAVLGGDIAEASGASVRGDRVVLPGRFWALLLLLSPVLVFVGMIWLVVWVVRRARYGTPRMRRY